MSPFLPDPFEKSPFICRHKVYFCYKLNYEIYEKEQQVC